MNFEGFLTGLHNSLGPHFTAGVTERGSHGPKQPADSHADPTKKKKPSATAAILGESLLWPIYMSDREVVAPAVVFGLSAFFGIPFFYPLTVPGASIVAAYGLGAATYMIESAGDQPISQIKGNPL